MPLPLPILPALLAQLSFLGLDSGSENYFELLERNSHIIYPSLGLMVLGLVALAIFQTAKAQELDGATRNELKRRIVEELRRYPAGLQTPELASAMGVERGKLVRLLNQMQDDGVLISHVTTQRHTVWRVKGIGGRAA
ncbi:MAG TPA: hypothetical protein VF794_39150 [Archangium sp.]|jgi:hypothetical protein|uniref:hypothetical protein n=1 Tax=Archangium sp. TaxID=1872627 RepID=UPI002ED89195